MEIKKETLYKFLLITLIISQVFGLYGGALTPTRLLAILYIPFCVNIDFIKAFRKQVFFTLFLIVFMLNAILLNLIYDNLEINDFIYFFINIIIVFEIIFFASQIRNAYQIIWKGWLLFIILTIPIAFYEILFDKHLSTSFLESDQVVGALGVQKKFAAVSFGNYNQYVVILCYALPIIVSRLLQREQLTKKTRWLITSVFVSILFIIGVNGSRGGILCYLLVFITFLFYIRKKNRFNKIFYLRLFLVSGLILGVGLYFLQSTNAFSYILFRLQSAGYEDQTRTQLIEAGVQMLVDSNFIGVGPGNFMNLLSNYNAQVRELPPHNFFVELFAQYGLVIFLFVIILLIKIFRKFFKTQSLPLRFLLLSVFVTLPVVCAINSVYVSLVNIWMFLASIYVLSNNMEYNEN